jgi:hypothetical protein
MAISLSKKTELKILTPVGMLGYWFSEQIFWEAIEEGVDAIILDSSSTDSGPLKLALGGTTVPREGYDARYEQLPDNRTARTRLTFPIGGARTIHSEARGRPNSGLFQYIH